MILFNAENMRRVIHHPQLVISFLHGGEVEASRKHIDLHIAELKKVQMPKRPFSTITMVNNALEICSRSCYDTQYLYLVCKNLRATKAVETGVHYGISSTFILKAMEESDGFLWSIDLPNIGYQRDDGKNHFDILPKGTESGFAVPERLKKRWSLMLGDSRQLLPTLLKQIGEVDIFHHDSMHTYDLMTFEYEAAWRHLRPGGLLISHDVQWNDAFSDFVARNSADYSIYRGRRAHIGIAIK